jgi:hypothetical protein
MLQCNIIYNDILQHIFVLECSYFSIFAYTPQWVISSKVISLILTLQCNLYHGGHTMHHCDLCQSFNAARYEKNRILNADIKAYSAAF